ncbi:AAA family ATPase [Parabacteroides distasonis]|uniref:ATP-binding protein n=1 Tax=Parabacteroides distasonis TaxID=823 RepID=UPI0039B58663
MIMKKIPYGLTDFERIRKEPYYYVDKTHYIERLEESANFFFLIRPRRFGKSLFINMLRWYYDIYRRDRFKEIFEGLYIGSRPTAGQGKYLVLDFNFAGVNPDPDRLLASFNDHCSMRFDIFAGLYGHMFNPGFADELKSLKNADEKLNYLIGQATLLDLPIYLFIDEYDNFTNAILSNVGNEHYRKLTHGTGFFRYFFNKLKEGATGNGPIKRMFITGVSPVTLDDVTSGFNIGANMSTDPRFNGIIGFSEREVRDMLSYYKDVDMLAGEVDEVIGVMKPWYDNYCFSRESLHEPMYNSDMVLYFLNHYLPLRKAPENMIDNNIRTDYNKLRHLIRLDKKMGMNASIIQDIVTNGSVTGMIQTALHAEDLTKSGNFKSLLYYFGLLCVCAFAIATAGAQDVGGDYISSAAVQSVIYHGKEQLKYPTSIRNHPYLKSEEYVPGDLSFEGILYKGVKMRLDLYKNELLLFSPDNRYNIVLPGDRVDYAEFHGYHIFYRHPDERSGNLPEGYYLRLHEGKCTVLGKWSCTLSKTIKDMQVDESFDQSVKYYIRKEGVYYTVRSKGSVLKVFKSKKKELARYIKRRKLDFRHAPEEAIVAVVRQYEQLNEIP